MTAACAICGSEKLAPLIARRDTPVFQNAVYADAAAANGVARGDLEFRRCDACGFVWNAAFASEKLAYSPAYENRQTLSPAFHAHLQRRAAAAIGLIEGRKAPVIVDVGCGQGDFLDYLAGAASGRARLFGFDPAWRGKDGEGPAGGRIYRRLFDRQEPLDGAPADLIVSRHVIEHIPEPMEFLDLLRRCCGPNTRLAIETPDIDWILRTGAFHDFFYEHCSLFSLVALDKALTRAGFVATRLERVFGEQYLWAEATPVEAEAAEPAAYQRRWEAAVARAAEAGPVVIWGAGAKGASFAQMFDPDASRIAAVVDLNPAKQDRRLGGSGHRIVSPDAAGAIAPATVLVMNPAYEEEIGDYIRGHGWAAEIIVVR